MTTTDTTVSNLIINKLTQVQYEAITTPSDTELYLTDEALTASDVTTALGYTPQAELVSGTNIKTVNSTSLLGSGNISISDTKNTAGSSNSSSKLYLIGATSQATNAVTYSKSTVYANTDGTLNCENPASTKNDTTVATTKWVKDLGYTTNTGTVTSVNNVSPVSGNVTISIPSEVTETTVSNWGFTKNVGTVTSVNSTSPDANGNVTLTIPTVNNATLTIQKNGTDVQTFTANASSDVTANITVPTQASDISALDISASNLSSTGQKVFDGQWVYLGQTIVTDATLNSSSDLTKKVNVPDDNNTYEVLFDCSITTGTTSGNFVILSLSTNKMSSPCHVCSARTRAASSVIGAGTVILPISYVNDNLTIARSTSINGTATIIAYAYRRVGTNT